MQRHIHITRDSYIRPYPPFQLNSRTEDTYGYILEYGVGYRDQVLLVMWAQSFIASYYGWLYYANQLTTKAVTIVWMM